MVGVSAARFHGTPLVTEDVDFLVRDTPLNRRKIARVAAALGPEIRMARLGELTTAVRLQGSDPPVDFLFALGGGLRFESVRSRATKISPGSGRVWVASLQDVIASKEAADRPKDKATLWILKQTAEINQRLAEGPGGFEPPKVAERRARYRLKRRPRARAATRS